MRLGLIAWLAIPFLLVLAVLWCYPAFGATPYKTYVIKKYKTWDILCDTYTVRRGDHIWELLRRRGCMAERDLANFTAILRRLNPHIRNVNRIYPGQEILIPLKQMKSQDITSGAVDRFVTIPFIPDILYTDYTLHPGDHVLKVAAELHGLQVHQLPERYLQTLKRLNPGIKNLNRVYPGQKVRIPEIASEGPSSEIALLGPSSARRSTGTPSLERRRQASPWSTLSASVRPLGGTLIESGHYFFPAKDKGNIKLDLSAFPVIELAGGRRLLLDTGRRLSEDTENVIRAFWKPLTIVRKEPGESRRSLLDKVFRTIHGGEVRQTVDIAMSDIGIHVTLRGDWILVQKGGEHSPPGYHCITLITDPHERISAALRDYLAGKNIRVSDVLPEGVDEDTNPEAQESDPAKPGPLTVDTSNPEIFVVEFVKAIGCSYDWNVPLSFQYAGSQVQTVTDLIHSEDGLDVIVDFGDFFGDTKSAIEAAGLKVLSVRPEDEVSSIARDFFRTAGISWTEDPIFFGANRNVFKTTSVTIPGFLASQGAQGKILLTSAPLPPKVCDFLEERKIRVLKMKPR
ncbi:MAG: LysM peptidoglycan-binding domain-containing protein [Desulfobacterales bacterium]|nr:MAG: LysM peptidoglycan-binding domain-containing protein [Desulfobacterales bacterium]